MYRSRFDFVIHIRQLADNSWEHEFDDEDAEPMDLSSSKGRGRGRRRKSAEKRSPNKDENAMDVDGARYRPGRHYKDQVYIYAITYLAKTV